MGRKGKILEYLGIAIFAAVPAIFMAMRDDKNLKEAVQEELDRRENLIETNNEEVAE